MKYTYSLGRRKTATSTLRLYEGKGEIMVNDKPISEVYPDPADKALILEPLRLVGQLDNYYFTAKTNGGGIKSQAGAIRHALARALAEVNPATRSDLKKAMMLRRDDRMKERKKTGLKKARKAPQFSKR